MIEVFQTLIDELNPVDLTQRLVLIDTSGPDGKERDAAALLVEWALKHGLEAQLQRLNERQANAVIRLPGNGAASTLLFCGHLDTVPAIPEEWQYPPFDGRVADGRLYGRGAADMKSGLATMLVALAALRESNVQLAGDVLLAAFCGEVSDWKGARHFLDGGGMAGVGWMVVGEPTDLDLVVAHRGVVWLELCVKGRSVHGSVSGLGRNPVAKVASLVRAFQSAWCRARLIRCCLLPRSMSRGSPVATAPTLFPKRARLRLTCVRCRA